MSQYMIIRGTASVAGKEPDPAKAVSVRVNGSSLELNGPAGAVDYYSKMLSRSLVIAQSFVDGEIILTPFASGLSMMDIALFDTNTFNNFKDEYEAIKGKRRVIKITRVPHKKDPDYSEDKVEQFYKSFRKKNTKPTK